MDVNIFTVIDKNIRSFYKHNNLNISKTSGTNFKRDIMIDNYFSYQNDKVSILLLNDDIQFPKKNLLDAIDSLQTFKKLYIITTKKNIDKIKDKIKIEDNQTALVLQYEVFTFDHFEHINIPKSRIVDMDEFDKIYNITYVDKEFFPKIKKTDPTAVWLIANVGDIIETRSYNSGTIYSCDYRCVV